MEQSRVEAIRGAYQERNILKLRHNNTMSDDDTKFPKVQGGGSLILAWQIRNKHVLVVGGGEVYSLSLPRSTSSCHNCHPSLPSFTH